MGLIASSSALSGGSLSVLAVTGVGTGGILVAALLAYLLGYLNVVEATDRDLRQLQSLLVIASVPLLFVFAAVIAVESLSVLGLL